MTKSQGYMVIAALYILASLLVDEDSPAAWGFVGVAAAFTFLAFVAIATEKRS